MAHVKDDEGIDNWMCVKKDCLFHGQNEHISAFKKKNETENVTDNIDEEWICVNKECRFHNHDIDHDN